MTSSGTAYMTVVSLQPGAALPPPLQDIEILRSDYLQSNDLPQNKFLVITHSSTPVGLDNALDFSSWKILHPALTPDTASEFQKPLGDNPLYFLVYFYIKKECQEEFIDLLLEECGLVHKLEEGNLRFDLCQSMEDPTQFLVLEAVRDRAALDEHIAFPHYQKVRAALETMQAKPRSHDKGYTVLSQPK